MWTSMNLSLSLPFLQHVIDNFPQFGIFRHHTSTSFGNDIESILKLHNVLSSIANRFLVQAFGDFVISYG